MVTIPNQVHDKENRRKLDNWTRASAFMEDFQSQVWLEICSRWFGLADYTTLYHEVEQFFITMMSAAEGLRMYDRQGLLIPMIDTRPNTLIEPMIFNDNHFGRFEGLQDVYYKPNISRWEDWRYAALVTPNQQF